MKNLANDATRAPSARRQRKAERQRGEGRIFPRGRIWWISYCHRGKEIRESSKSDNEGDAWKLLRRRLRTAGSAAFVDPKVERITVDELGEAYLRDYRLNRRRSLRDAERNVRQIGTMFAGRLARELDDDPGLIEAYKDARLQDRTPADQPIKHATINRELAALRRMFSVGRRTWKGFRYRPLITLFPEDNVRESFAEPAVFEQIITNLRELDADVADGVEFAYEAAWRKREPFALQLSHVEWRADDLSRGVLRLPGAHTKNKRERILPLKGKLLEIVQRRWVLRRPDCPFLFHRRGRPIREFRKRWQQACEAAGVVPGRAGLTVHDLRRSGIRNMRRAGITEAVAMRISGHKTRNVFERYNIVDENDLAEAIGRVTAYTARERKRKPRVVRLRAADGNELGQFSDNPASEAPTQSLGRS